MTHKNAGIEPVHSRLKSVEKSGHLRCFDTQNETQICRILDGLNVTGIKPEPPARKIFFDHFFTVFFSHQKNVRLEFTRMSHSILMACSLKSYFIRSKTYTP